MSARFLRQMLRRVGVMVPERELRKRTPHELSLTEKWVFEMTYPATGNPSRMPLWLRPWKIDAR